MNILPTILNTGASVLGKLTSDDRADKMYDSMSSLPKMPNYYNSYGNKSIRKLQGLGENIKSQKTNALNELKSGLSQSRLQSSAEINSLGGSLNTRRAMRALADRSYNKSLASGMSSLEDSVMKQMSQLGLAESNILADRDKLVGAANEKSFMMDLENKKQALNGYYNMKQQGDEYMIQGLGNLAQTMNANDNNKKFLDVLGTSMNNTPTGILGSSMSSGSYSYDPWQFSNDSMPSSVGSELKLPF